MLSLFTQNNKFLMLALDHRGSFKKLINPQDPERVDKKEIIDLKFQIINALGAKFSSVLLDPEFGLLAYRKYLEQNEKSKPFLLSTEKSGYQDLDGEKITELEYSVEQLKNLGARGIKLLLYFNPYVNSAKQQVEIGRKVLKDCKNNDLPLFLEIVTYGISNENKVELIRNSVKYFLDQGVLPDVFKLEFPGGPGSCLEITRILKETPWILLSGGYPFEEFLSNLKVAIDNGASGFLAGRALWQDFHKYQGEKREEFFNKVVAERFEEISKVVNKI